MGEWQEEKEPTVLTKGLKTRKCVCGYKESEEIEKKQIDKNVLQFDIKKVAIAVACVVVPILLFFLFFAIKILFSKS